MSLSNLTSGWHKSKTSQQPPKRVDTIAYDEMLDTGMLDSKIPFTAGKLAEQARKTFMWPDAHGRWVRESNRLHPRSSTGKRFTTHSAPKYIAYPGAFEYQGTPCLVREVFSTVAPTSEDVDKSAMRYRITGWPQDRESQAHHTLDKGEFCILTEGFLPPTYSKSGASNNDSRPAEDALAIGGIPASAFREMFSVDTKSDQPAAIMGTAFDRTIQQNRYKAHWPLAEIGSVITELEPSIQRYLQGYRKAQASLKSSAAASSSASASKPCSSQRDLGSKRYTNDPSPEQDGASKSKTKATGLPSDATGLSSPSLLD